MRFAKGLIGGVLRALSWVVLTGVILAPVGTAHAVQMLSVPEADQASDPVTVVEVNKLSFAEGHAAVSGARLQIVEASTGRVVYEWVTDGSTVTVNRSTYFNGERVNLNLDTVYLLHEVSAPAGYSVAPDVRFEITGIYDSDVTLYDDADGHAYLTGAHQITLFDDSTVQPRYVEDVEYVHQPDQVVHRDNTEEGEAEGETPEEQPQNILERLAQTGDLGYLPAIFAATAGFCVLALGLRRKRCA